MKFGKVKKTALDQLDLSLPVEASQNKALLKKQGGTKKAKIYTGCPVWVNKTWVGSTYPAGTREKDYLKQYTRQFNTIELNTTHYHIPDAKTIQRWKQNAHQGFKFSPKFPQEISHQRLMEGKAQALTQIFCESIVGLEDHLGLSFLQLPPYFEPRHLDHLEDFLRILPREVRVAVEFRHPLWFVGENYESAAQLLEAYGASAVITDTAGRRDVIHMRLSSPSVIIRFVGYELHPSDYIRCEDWAKKIGQWIAQGAEEVYFFVHQPENNLSPDLARFFIQKMNENCSLDLQIPKSYQQGIQKNLFG